MTLDVLPADGGVHAELDDPASAKRPRRRRLLLKLFWLTALVAALVLVGVLVDPSAGAAGGCGGG